MFLRDDKSIGMVMVNHKPTSESSSPAAHHRPLQTGGSCGHAWHGSTAMLRRCTGRSFGRDVRMRPTGSGASIGPHSSVACRSSCRRWPVGNAGGANVSAFKPMITAPDLERLVKDRDR
ncbi:DUF3703 domain-containing protein [Aquincola sp. J276]|uniref:DUF3703 domain-containing protein n=1 Tax=Aquincola sp. J276 TaxID=2898432 RepID=UPI003857EF2A